MIRLIKLWIGLQTDRIRYALARRRVRRIMRMMDKLQRPQSYSSLTRD
jgi:hypothetical protein